MVASAQYTLVIYFISNPQSLDYFIQSSSVAINYHQVVQSLT